MSTDCFTPNSFAYILFRVLQLAASQEWHIAAVGLGGSQARKDNLDEYSDLDLFLLSEDSHLTSLIRRMPELARHCGEVLIFRGPIYIEHYGYSFTVLYDSASDPIKVVQFNLNSMGGILPGPNRKHTRILYDPSGFYKAFTDSQMNLIADPSELFTTSTSFFWLRVINVWRDLLRYDLWLAIHHLADVRRQLFVLLRLMRSTPPLDYYLVEKHMEGDIGEDTCSVFAETLPAYNASSIRYCLRFCIEWFSRNAPLYAKQIGKIYPAEVAQKIYRMISKDITQ